MPVNVQQLRRATRRIAARAVGEDFKQPKNTVAAGALRGSQIQDMLNGPVNAATWQAQYNTDSTSGEYGVLIDPPGY